MQIAYANVFVSDLARAVSFFEKLGLTLCHSSAEHGYAAFEAGPIRLGLAVAGPEQAELVGRHTGLGFMVRDVEAEHRRLSGLGVHFTMAPSHQPWGGFMGLFADPDDNVYYLDQLDDAQT